MDSDPADLTARAIAAIRDRLAVFHPARGALTSDLEAARHGDPEIAIDDASQVLQYFGTPIRADEFRALHAAATHFSMADFLEGIVVLPPGEGPSAHI
ncbi:hypothetical protein ABZ371_07825 [Streptomyces sp. NPDC005899]|uniref:hypothetical protein n=1 Tax=Streptomyces sp. NPDC005899 TaxID=3155716 RepID=UPI00340147F6